MKDFWLYIFTIGFVLGVACHSFFNVSLYVVVFLFLLSCAIGVVSFFSQKIVSQKIFLAAILLFAVSVGLLRFSVSDLHKGDLAIDAILSKEVSVTGVVTDEPDERDTHTKLTINAEEITFGTSKIKSTTKILVLVERFPRYSYGDRLELKGVIVLPQSGAKGDSSFDYAAFLAKDGIYYQMLRPKVTLIEHGQGNPLKAALFDIKNGFLASTDRLLPQEESSLLGGLVIGAKRALGADLLEKFRQVGIIHIVVLSGYNITIVADAIMKVFSFLPRNFSLSLGSLSIVFFAIMTGGSATVVRASIMALLVLFAKAIGRDYQITRALLLAGLFMVFQNPKILAFDTSFQLSFLATIGLIYVAPLFEKRFTFLPEKFQIRELAVSTIATQITVLPLLLSTTGVFSIVSLPVNLLILPLIPATMLFGFIAGMIGMLSSLLAFPFTWVAHLLLWYELTIVNLFSSIPFAAITISGFSAALAGVVYIFYVGIFLFLKKGKV